MKSYGGLLGFLAFLLTVPSLLAADDQDATSRNCNRHPPIAAPVHYADVTVVLADAKGVAAITFQCPATIERTVLATSDVVEYRYRYRASDGAEASGQGVLYENYKHTHDEKNVVVDNGGRLQVEAGHFQLEWSHGGSHRGWLYYTPEKLRMQFTGSRQFDELALSRFMQ